MVNNIIGFIRIIKVVGYFWKGFCVVWIYEVVFCQESIVVLLGVIIVCWLDVDVIICVLLIGFVLFIMIVEIFNSVIEVVVDCIGFEYYEFFGCVKDMGLVVVLLFIFVVLMIWGILLWLYF